MKRNTPLRRHVGIKRSGGFIARRSRPRSVSPKRRALKDEYREIVRPAYLAEHPLCQIYLAEHRLIEAEAVAAFRSLGESGIGRFYWKGHDIPLAEEIHHRNKSNGVRLTDTRFFMSASREWHDRVENAKDWARLRCYLLPINADPNGRAGGVNYMQTPELMEYRACGPR